MQYPDLDHTCHICHKDCKLKDGCPETGKGWRCSACWDALLKPGVPQGLDAYIQE